MGPPGYLTVPGESQSDTNCSAGDAAADGAEALSELRAELRPGKTAAPQLRICTKPARAAALLMLPVLVLAAVVGLAPLGSRQLRSSTQSGPEVSFLGASEAAHCEPDVEDVDLWTGVGLYEVQGVTKAADCRSKCTDDKRCGAWTWGEKRDVKYLSDVCFLKELRNGHPIKRHVKEGVVSGLPCRPGEAPLPPAGGQSDEFNCNTGFSNWKAGWSTAKKKWCCANKERACDSNSRPPARSQATEKAQAAPLVECHDVAHDVDYWTGTPLYEVDQIKRAADCRAKCEEDPKCGAWTWGENPGITGLEGVCFLKGLVEGHQPEQHPKKGVQSGVPCRGEDKPSGARSSAGGSEPSPGGSKSSLEVPPHLTGHGNCGEIAEDTDYSTSTSLSEVVNMATAEICLNKCEGDRKCGAWSWGKARNSIGLTDVCFLKGLREGETPKKLSKQGVVSGVPCHTSSWLAKEEANDGTGLQHYQSVTLHCFALMIPHSYEQKLLSMQYYEHASLFACEQAVVYSNISLELVPGIMTHVVDSDLHCEFGGEFGTALNTDIFLAVWKKVVSDAIYLTCDWTAKIDPDAVFFAARLRGALEAHSEAPEGVYINNCWRGMHGPIEVFSRNAVEAWSTGTERCLEHFNKLCNGPCLWGEDMFIDQCLWKVLHVRRDNEYALLTEDHCDPPKGWKSCKMPGSIAFHPFKKPAAYQECLFNADPLARFVTTPTTTTVPVQLGYEPVTGQAPSQGAFPGAVGPDGSISADGVSPQASGGGSFSAGGASPQASGGGSFSAGGASPQASGVWSGSETAASMPSEQPLPAAGATASQYAGAAASQLAGQSAGQSAWAPSPAALPAPSIQAGQIQGGYPTAEPSDTTSGVSVR